MASEEEEMAPGEDRATFLRDVFTREAAAFTTGLEILKRYMAELQSLPNASSVLRALATDSVPSLPYSLGALGLPLHDLPHGLSEREWRAGKRATQENIRMKHAAEAREVGKLTNEIQKMRVFEGSFKSKEKENDFDDSPGAIDLEPCEDLQVNSPLAQVSVKKATNKLKETRRRSFRKRSEDSSRVERNQDRTLKPMVDGSAGNVKSTPGKADEDSRDHTTSFKDSQRLGEEIRSAEVQGGGQKSLSLVKQEGKIRSKNERESSSLAENSAILTLAGMSEVTAKEREAFAVNILVALQEPRNIATNNVKETSRPMQDHVNEKINGTTKATTGAEVSIRVSSRFEEDKVERSHLNSADESVKGRSLSISKGSTEELASRTKENAGDSRKRGKFVSKNDTDLERTTQKQFVELDQRKRVKTEENGGERPEENTKRPGGEEKGRGKFSENSSKRTRAEGSTRAKRVHGRPRTKGSVPGSVAKEVMVNAVENKEEQSIKRNDVHEGEEQGESEKRRGGGPKKSRARPDTVSNSTEIVVKMSASPKGRKEKQKNSRDSLPSEILDIRRAPLGRRRKGAESAESAVRSGDKWMIECYRMWQKIYSHSYAKYFREPVTLEEAPDYFDIIENPMDLGKIGENLRNGTLSTPHEFKRAMYLVCNNSMAYNPKDSDLYAVARDLKEIIKEEVASLIREYRKDVREKGILAKQREKQSSRSSASKEDEEETPLTKRKFRRGKNGRFIRKRDEEDSSDEEEGEKETRKSKRRERDRGSDSLGSARSTKRRRYSRRWGWD